MFANLRRVLALAVLLGSIGLHAGSEAGTEAARWPAEWQADSAFYGVWASTDAPVALAKAARSWVWGPLPFAVANEPYAESATGSRLVEYLDKARMEVNDPRADRTSPWFVTTGLLVTEMVTGQMQTGNSRFEQRAPADVVVAGDANSPHAPVYASFAAHTGPASSRTGAVVQEEIGRDGAVTQAAPGVPSDPKLFAFVSFDSVTKHNVPAVFSDWMAQSGLVEEGGYFSQGRVLADPLYVLGHPITEPYWADVLVSGAPTKVLVQLFERRALTYNPNNPAQWRVEMANVGRAYYNWRYGKAGPPPAVAAQLIHDTLFVRGWNWPPSSAVTVQITGQDSGQPSEVERVTADAAGRFASASPISEPGRAAMAGTAGARVEAIADGLSDSLPVASSDLAGPKPLDGTLTGVPASIAGPGKLLLVARDGQEWTLSVGQSSQIVFSEGKSATTSDLRVGQAVVAEGTFALGGLAVSRLHLFSTSSTGAQLAYSLSPDGKSLRLSGTGWSPGKQVILSLANAAGSAVRPLGTYNVDSRGDVDASMTAPSGDLPDKHLWLIAGIPEKSAPAVQVALPFDAPYTPPLLVIGARSGEAAGRAGSSCAPGSCPEAVGSPLPWESLSVKAGEVLSLRGDASPGSYDDVLPVTFGADVYAQAPDWYSQGAFLGGGYFFMEASQPVFSTGEVKGAPSSIALPAGLERGSYALLVHANWPGQGTATTTAQYGFRLDVK